MPGISCIYKAALAHSPPVSRQPSCRKQSWVYSGQHCRIIIRGLLRHPIAANPVNPFMVMELGWNNRHHQDCQSDIILNHHQKICVPHTIANKLTGFLLFLTVPTISWCIIPIAIVAIIAQLKPVELSVRADYKLSNILLNITPINRD